MTKSPPVLPALTLAVASVITACTPAPALRDASTVSQTGSTSTATATTAPPAAAAPAHAHALHNVHRLSENLVSGAAPEGDAAFDELKAMGIRTIITVDGAAPDLPRASARGMRYVHIPITYAEVTPDQQLKLARAVKELPGPIFLHCHHGKHRGPAAIASAAVLLGKITPEEGVAFMKVAGTAPNYTGLYECVATARPASPERLASAPGDFPAVRRPEGITSAMVEIDSVYELLGEIRTAGWTTPSDHPDLVPVAEAGRLADLLRVSGEDPKTKPWGEDYARRLASSVAAASTLEQGFGKKASPAEMEAAWKAVAASCKDCHARYRDKR